MYYIHCIHRLLQSTKVRLNLVRDMRRELEQRWSPKEKRRLLRIQWALYMHWDYLSNYGRSTCLVAPISEWHSPVAPLMRWQ